MHTKLSGFFTWIVFTIVPFIGFAETEPGPNNNAVTYNLPVIDKSHIESDLNHATETLQRISLLGELAAYYVTWEADAHKADSLLSVGIDMAELSYNNEFLLEAYSNYLIYIDDYTFTDKVSRIVPLLGSMSGQLTNKKEVWKCKYALAYGCKLIFQTDRAKDYAHQALTEAIRLKDNNLTAESHLLLGSLQHDMNNNVEAIRNYLDALTIAENGSDLELRLKCYDELSTFYNLIKAYDKSINYKLKELNIAEHAKKPDSMRIMTIKFDMEVIAFNNRTLNENQLYKIIDYSNRNGVSRLKRFALVVFRNHLIKQSNFAELYHLYNEEYPEELEYIRTNDTTTYFRLEAMFNEYEGDVVTAKEYFDKAAQGINRSKDKLRQSSFYLRYGDFLQRNNFLEEARDCFRRSYTIAASINYYEFMVEATGKLEKIYSLQNNFEEAYAYSLLNKSTSESLDSLMQKEQLQILELENEEVLRDQQLQQERDETRRRNNIQYTAITILIATFFLMLFILGGIRVSPAIIRFLGFVSFIFFFEFLILLFDTWIHHLTHGEPWKILAIKILLMCGLVPLHHMIEKRVISYIISHKMNLIPKRSPKPVLVEADDVREEEKA